MHLSYGLILNPIPVSVEENRSYQRNTLSIMPLMAYNIDSWCRFEYAWISVYHFTFECWRSWSLGGACSSDVVRSHSAVTEDVGGDKNFEI